MRLRFLIRLFTGGTVIFDRPGNRSMPGLFFHSAQQSAVHRNLTI
jgi:hypothetical protein